MNMKGSKNTINPGDFVKQLPQGFYGSSMYLWNLDWPQSFSDIKVVNEPNLFLVVARYEHNGQKTGIAKFLHGNWFLLIQAGTPNVGWCFEEHVVLLS